MKNKQKIVLVVLMAVFCLATVHRATATVSFYTLTTSATIKTLTTDTTYEKSIGASVVFTPNINVSVENVTSPKIYFYAQQSGETLVLASETVAGSAFVNNTQQSLSTTLYIDEESLAGQKLTDDCLIIVWAKIYNSTVTSANYIDGDSTSVRYGDLINDGGTSESEEALLDKAIRYVAYLSLIVIAGAAIILFAIVVIIKRREMLD